VCVFRVENLTGDGDVTLESYLQSLQQKEARVVDLEHLVRQLSTTLDFAETKCRSVKKCPCLFVKKVKEVGFV